MGGFFPKNFFRNFFVYPLQRGLCPHFDIYKGEEGRGDTSPHSQGGGMGGYYREGVIKKPLCNYRGVGCIFDISK
jgi:hypothetical protein